MKKKKKFRPIIREKKSPPSTTDDISRDIRSPRIRGENGLIDR